MIRNHKTFLGSVLLLTILCISPMIAFAANVSIVIPYPQLHYKPLGRGGVTGSFTSNITVYAFISNWTGVSYFTTHASVPSYALWSDYSTSGSYNVSFPDDQSYYIAFANLHFGESALVQYTYSSSGIPGFELVFLLFALTALLGLVGLKKRRPQ